MQLVCSNLFILVATFVCLRHIHCRVMAPSINGKVKHFESDQFMQISSDLKQDSVEGSDLILLQGSVSVPDFDARSKKRQGEKVYNKNLQSAAIAGVNEMLVEEGLRPLDRAKKSNPIPAATMCFDFSSQNPNESPVTVCEPISVVNQAPNEANIARYNPLIDFSYPTTPLVVLPPSFLDQLTPSKTTILPAPWLPGYEFSPPDDQYKPPPSVNPPYYQVPSSQYPNTLTYAGVPNTGLPPQTYYGPPSLPSYPSQVDTQNFPSYPTYGNSNMPSPLLPSTSAPRPEKPAVGSGKNPSKSGFPSTIKEQEEANKAPNPLEEEVSETSNADLNSRTAAAYPFTNYLSRDSPVGLVHDWHMAYKPLSEPYDHVLHRGYTNSVSYPSNVFYLAPGQSTNQVAGTLPQKTPAAKKPQSFSTVALSCRIHNAEDKEAERFLTDDSNGEPVALLQVFLKPYPSRHSNYREGISENGTKISGEHQDTDRGNPESPMMQHAAMKSNLSPRTNLIVNEKGSGLPETHDSMPEDKISSQELKNIYQQKQQHIRDEMKLHEQQQHPQVFQHQHLKDDIKQPQVYQQQIIKDGMKWQQQQQQHPRMELSEYDTLMQRVMQQNLEQQLAQRRQELDMQIIQTASPWMYQGQLPYSNAPITPEQLYLNEYFRRKEALGHFPYPSWLREESNQNQNGSPRQWWDVTQMQLLSPQNQVVTYEQHPQWMPAYQHSMDQEALHRQLLTKANQQNQVVTYGQRQKWIPVYEPSMEQEVLNRQLLTKANQQAEKILQGKLEDWKHIYSLAGKSKKYGRNETMEKQMRHNAMKAKLQQQYQMQAASKQVSAGGIDKEANGLANPIPADDTKLSSSVPSIEARDDIEINSEAAGSIIPTSKDSRDGVSDESFSEELLHNTDDKKMIGGKQEQTEITDMEAPLREPKLLPESASKISDEVNISGRDSDTTEEFIFRNFNNTEKIPVRYTNNTEKNYFRNSDNTEESPSRNLNNTKNIPARNSNTEQIPAWDPDNTKEFISRNSNTEKIPARDSDNTEEIPDVTIPSTNNETKAINPTRNNRSSSIAESLESSGMMEKAPMEFTNETNVSTLMDDEGYKKSINKETMKMVPDASDIDQSIKASGRKNEFYWLEAEPMEFPWIHDIPEEEFSRSSGVTIPSTNKGSEVIDTTRNNSPSTIAESLESSGMMAKAPMKFINETDVSTRENANDYKQSITTFEPVYNNKSHTESENNKNSSQTQMNAIYRDSNDNVTEVIGAAKVTPSDITVFSEEVYVPHDSILGGTRINSDSDNMGDSDDEAKDKNINEFDTTLEPAVTNDNFSEISDSNIDFVPTNSKNLVNRGNVKMEDEVGKTGAGKMSRSDIMIYSAESNTSHETNKSISKMNGNNNDSKSSSNKKIVQSGPEGGGINMSAPFIINNSLAQRLEQDIMSMNHPRHTQLTSDNLIMNSSAIITSGNDTNSGASGKQPSTSESPDYMNGTRSSGVILPKDIISSHEISYENKSEFINSSDSQINEEIDELPGNTKESKSSSTPIDASSSYGTNSSDFRQHQSRSGNTTEFDQGSKNSSQPEGELPSKTSKMSDENNVSSSDAAEQKVSNVSRSSENTKSNHHGMIYEPETDSRVTGAVFNSSNSIRDSGRSDKKSASQTEISEKNSEDVPRPFQKNGSGSPRQQINPGNGVPQAARNRKADSSQTNVNIQPHNIYPLYPYIGFNAEISPTNQLVYQYPSAMSLKDLQIMNDANRFYQAQSPYDRTLFKVMPIPQSYMVPPSLPFHGFSVPSNPDIHHKYIYDDRKNIDAAITRQTEKDINERKLKAKLPLTFILEQK